MIRPIYLQNYLVFFIALGWSNWTSTWSISEVEDSCTVHSPQCWFSLIRGSEIHLGAGEILSWWIISGSPGECRWSVDRKNSSGGVNQLEKKTAVVAGTNSRYQGRSIILLSWKLDLHFFFLRCEANPDNPVDYFFCCGRSTCVSLDLQPLHRCGCTGCKGWHKTAEKESRPLQASDQLVHHYWGRVGYMVIPQRWLGANGYMVTMLHGSHSQRLPRSSEVLLLANGYIS